MLEAPTSPTQPNSFSPYAASSRSGSGGDPSDRYAAAYGYDPYAAAYGFDPYAVSPLDPYGEASTTAAAASSPEPPVSSSPPVSLYTGYYWSLFGYLTHLAQWYATLIAGYASYPTPNGNVSAPASGTSLPLPAATPASPAAADYGYEIDPSGAAYAAWLEDPYAVAPHAASARSQSTEAIAAQERSSVNTDSIRTEEGGSVKEREGPTAPTLIPVKMVTWHSRTKGDP